MLVEMAIADAYAAAFEYVPRSDDRPNDGRSYWQHPKHLGLRPGMYTDDTQMSIAVARCLVNGTWTPEGFASEFVATFKTDPRDGYARGFQAFLEQIEDGLDFMAKIRPDSNKSGAAMRAAPIGLLSNYNQVLAIARLQAQLTHNTPSGLTSASAAALMVYHQANGLGQLRDLPEFLNICLPDVPWDRPWTGRTGQIGLDIVRAAVTVVSRADSLTDLLIQSVEVGGDTDTLATIAMACASLSTLPNDLAPELVAKLEGGPHAPFGLELLRDLDDQLATKFGHSRVSSDI